MKKIIVSLLFSQLIFLILYPLWQQLTIYLNNLVIGLIWFLLTLIGLFIGLFWAKMKIFISRRVLHSLMIIYSALLLVLLFFRPSIHTDINLIPFKTIQFFLSGNVNLLIAFYNLIANIALFVPFGLYYRSIKKENSLIQLLVLSSMTISVIEGLQFFTSRGSLDIDDLILNVLGVMFGFYLYPIFHKVLRITSV